MAAALVVVCLTLAWLPRGLAAASGPRWCPAAAHSIVEDGAAGREERCELDGGVQHGPYEAWYPSGVRKARGSYRHGVAHGRWTHWYDNGRKTMEGKRRDGAVYGLWTYWYDDGQERMRGEWQFENGLRHGRWIHWDRDGSRQAEGQWRNGQKSGLWVEKGARGDAMKWVRYEAGVRTNESVRITMEALHQAGGVPDGWEFLPPPGNADDGRRLYEEFGCHSCHAVAGENFATAADDPGASGPELTGMGSHHPPGYFAESILNPDAVLIEGPGYIGSDGRSRMPAYPEMTLTQLADIVAYVRSLSIEECVHH
jgi:mono/diheme cytochrome c family protein